MMAAREFALAITLASCIGAPAYADSTLGRFFYTPQERRALDQQQIKDTEHGASSQTVTLNGKIVRSDGKTSVWLNSVWQPTDRGSRPERRVVRVGESVDTRSGDVSDVLNGAGVVVHKPTAR